MSEPLLVAFRAEKSPDGRATLFCKEMSAPGWPAKGRLYDNWQQLVGTMSEILGRPESDFASMRINGNVLENQRVTEQQLTRFQFPNLKRAPPSAQGTLPPDGEI